MKTTVVNKRVHSYDVYIGRPSPFGNPFEIGKDGTRPEVIQKYREWLESRPLLKARVRRELKGKVLGCFCKPAACHGDVLADVANGTDQCETFPY